MEFLGKNGFVWWKGVVEDRKDPLKLGRCKVRIIGWHTDDRAEMPTDALPWAYPSFSIEPTPKTLGLKEGDWVWGFFRDDDKAQEPVVVGYFPGIPEETADPSKGFSDPTSEKDLTSDKQPRPPEYSPPKVSSESGETTPSGQFSDPNTRPGDNIAFGELKKDFDPKNFRFDINKDGKYDASDAKTLIDELRKISITGLFSGEEEAIETPSYPMSRYPLKENLNEPSISRLARGENLEKTIVAKKKGKLSNGNSAIHGEMGVGSDQGSDPEPFSEPKTPYAAVYPYNRVDESESGHVIEVDDTPGAERLHRYHRSGTFEEIHPDGTRVLKGVNKGYNFFIEDYYFATGKSASLDAHKDFLINAGESMNLAAKKDMNQDCGGNRNIFTHGDANTKIGKNAYTVIEGDVRILVKGDYNLAVEGDLKIISKGDILIDGTNIKTNAKAENIVAAGGTVVTSAPVTYFDSAITDGVNIHAKHADRAAGVAGPVPHISFVTTFEKENDADNKDNLITSSSPKEGYIIYGPAGILWKPESDSDGKVVTLGAHGSAHSTPHQLFEALPTGALQSVTLEYKHPDFSITSWDLVRPVHTPGQLIDQGVNKGMFGDRPMYRWSKSGAEYPSQMFLKVGEHKFLILDGAIRHEAFGGEYPGY